MPDSPVHLAGTTRSLCHRLQPLVPAGGAGVTVLVYHLVGAAAESPVNVPLADFRRQVEEIAELGGATSLSRAVDMLQDSTKSLAQDLVVVTFDDAFANFGERAWPILHELEVPATLFVPTDFLDRLSGAPLAGAEHLPSLGWEEIEAMQATGLLEVGSHSRSHPDLRTLSQRCLEDEVFGSRRIIEERIGVRPRAFCYPRGRVSSQAEGVVARCYSAAVIGGGRKNGPKVNPLRINRIPIRRDMDTSIRSLVRSFVGIEEWIADCVRRWRG